MLDSERAVRPSTTGFRGWTITVGTYAVTISVNRAKFVTHIETRRGAFVNPPGSEVVRYAGLDWAPGAYGYKAVTGQFILIVRPNMEWVVYDAAMEAGKGVVARLTEAADAAVAVVRRVIRAKNEAAQAAGG